MRQKENSPKKLFYGWVITSIVFLNLAMAYGAQYSFGVLFPSLIEEFKWNRQSLAGAFSLYTFMYSILGMILGPLTDRFGPRIVLIFGSACLGMGIGLISQVKTVWHIYIFYGLLASWGMSAAYITSNPTIVKWFIEKRGLALGLAQSGQGIGIIFLPPLIGAQISTFGWRPACVILGGLVFIVLFTTSFFLIGHPEKIGLQPDGRQNKPRVQSWSPTQKSIDPEYNWSVAEAIRTQSFWVLTSLFFCTWLFIFLPLVHLVIFAMDMNLSKEVALIALSLLGVFATLGRLTMGFISDRIGRKKTLMINLCLQIFSWLWIIVTTQSWMILLFTTVFGFSYAGITAVFPAIVGDYFGRFKAASLIGVMFTIAGSAAAIGPLVGGYLYDLTKSYQLAFLLGALTNLLSLILLFISQPPPKYNSRSMFRG
jgi:MFS family permease